jgi:hemerythrin
VKTVTLAIHWDSKYSVHNEEIDTEHRKLLDLANSVFAIQDPNRQAAEFRRAVKELFRYMEYHFRHEEELMERVGYPDRVPHGVLHKSIVATMNSLLLNCSNLVDLSEKLRHFLVEWVLNHMAEEDSKITASVDHKAKTGA